MERIAEGDTKSFRFPQKLYFKLSVLAENVSTNVDFAPNSQQFDVFETLHARLSTIQKSYEKITTDDLRAFNERLKEENPELRFIFMD